MCRTCTFLFPGGAKICIFPLGKCFLRTINIKKERKFLFCFVFFTFRILECVVNDMSDKRPT